MRFVLACLLLLAAFRSSAADETNFLEIRYVNSNGKISRLQGKDAVTLDTYPENVTFGFGPRTNMAKPPLRLCYTLDGYENIWHEDPAEMGLTVRFYNDAGDQIAQHTYRIHGESTGWTGSLKNSSLTHRREALIVPPQARRFIVVISSAGPADTVGIYVVANLIVSKTSNKQGNITLLESPFDTEHKEPFRDDLPPGWIHDGITPSMARIVKFGQDPQIEAFAILDEDRNSHGEWHNILESSPVVSPGDNLVVEWNEMYSMGYGNFHEGAYGPLPAGNYKFRVRGMDVMGVPTGAETSLNVFVPQPFWKTSWFWAIAIFAITVIMVGIGRYFVWHRMRREMVRLKHQRALEQERLRIAHDIHDDLGARVTQISLLSAMSQDNAAFPEKARAEFDRISKMSRELVSALYETVWAVSPENDNLEALGSYLCQMVNKLCEQTPLRCRFNTLSLPHEVQVSSQMRHNINMAVKEAVHNIIKYAKATELTMRITFEEGILHIFIQDNGIGFQPNDTAGGHGLTNMQQRLSSIGGRCLIESKPGQGTTVRIRIAIKPLKKTL